ncbi:MAG: carboxypeptidase regulatory-like domain-containing protein [Archangiaceae bacterium]|nr:carboxypeptidase regulatory-like domain-containing protein [Archangiaceae bacterium]
MRAAILSLVAVALGGCAADGHVGFRPPDCVLDSDCPGAQVCFQDGCGDPGSNLYIEVTGDNTSLHPQDFDVSAMGGASAVMNLSLRGPLTLSGRLQRNAPELGGPVDYNGGVTITANGQSDLIQGLFRHFSTVVLPDTSAYQMFIGAGSYSVTARANDVSVPYQTTQINSGPGRLSGASFTFKSVNDVITVNGRLVKTSKPVLVTQPGMSIQAFETVNGTPLSQISLVSSSGDFTLHLDPAAAFSSSIALVASPRDSTLLVPSKTFVVSPVPVSQSTLGVLELGEFGDKLPALTGTLLGSDGRPIASATVKFEGKVNGDGVFKSRTVVTDEHGVFSVDLLPSERDEQYLMTAVPPAGNASGIMEIKVSAGLYEQLPSLLSGSPLAPKTEFTCPPRLQITGRVTQPNGQAAFGVRVTATALASLEDPTSGPLPIEPISATTDFDGQYHLSLDPARYQLDYAPADGLLPRKSRIVRVSGDFFDAGSALELGEVVLSAARTVSGTVSVRPNTLDVVNLPDGGVDLDAGQPYSTGAPVANAVVRFYRVSSVEGLASALLVGEAVCDEKGYYSVAVPDRAKSTPAP